MCLSVWLSVCYAEALRSSAAEQRCPEAEHAKRANSVASGRRSTEHAKRANRVATTTC